MPQLKDKDLAGLVEVMNAKEDELRRLRERVLELEAQLASRTAECVRLRKLRDETIGDLGDGLDPVPEIVLTEEERARLASEIQRVRDNSEKWRNAYTGLKVTVLSAFKTYVAGLLI